VGWRRFAKPGRAAKGGAGLRLDGYSIEEKPAADAASKSPHPAPPNPFLVVATSEAVLNPWVVQPFVQLFEQLASHSSGDCDGWKATAHP
jgi:hypothetical protein